MTTTEDDTYVIRGPDSVFPLSRRTLGQDMLRTLPAWPENTIAMIDAFTKKKLLYRALLQKSINLAQVLRHHGYRGQSAIFSISSENSLEFFVPVLAAFFNGSIMAPLNHTYTAYELEHVLRISCPQVVFCSPDVAQMFLLLKKKLAFVERIVVLGQRAPGGAETMDSLVDNVLRGKDVDVSKFEAEKGDVSKMIALIMCSSGTTGLPKGVALSHLNINVILSHAKNTNYYVPAQSNILGVLPFFHAYGLIMAINGFAHGWTVICLKKFDEDIFLKSIQDYKITTLQLAPPLAVFLSKSPKVAQYDLSSVTDVVCGAAPLSKSTEKEVQRRLKCDYLRQGYGLTEMTLAVTSVNKQQARKPGSCGKVMPYLMAKVRDPENGKSLGPNKVGELCFKGPSRMLGYYKNEQATKDILTADGWLRSGDLGYYDEEGNFFVIDRLKELIKFKGFQVAPAELEALLLTHPKIDDVGVVGKPDDLVGERPLAFVVKKQGTEIDEGEVQRYVADLVSPQKRLSGGVIFVDSIPKNPSGKILRRELRDLLKQYDKKSVMHSKL